MLATTARGDGHTFAKYRDVFARAGFVRSEFSPLPPATQQAGVSYKDGPEGGTVVTNPDCGSAMSSHVGIGRS